MNGRSSSSLPFVFAISFLFLLGLMKGTVEGVKITSKQVSVDCAKGETIADALAKGTIGEPLVILIQGMCSEDVTIARDDVTLEGVGTGVTVASTDPNRNTILIQGARRVILDNLTITGARNGVVGIDGASFTVQNSNIQSNTRSGVVAIRGSSTTIQGNTIQNNGGSGVVITETASGGVIDGNTIQNNTGNGLGVFSSSSANITNNTILSNGGRGIELGSSAHGTVGISTLNVPGPNVLSNNGLDGIAISNGASGFMFGNTVQSNGLSTGRHGIGIDRAIGRLVGGNTIQGNGGHGVRVSQGSLLQGMGDFSVPSAQDLIQANFSSGIFAINAGSLDIRNATISGNGFDGIGVALHSILRISGSGVTISGNSARGIQVSGDSAAALDFSVSVTGNSIGIQCFDTESSLSGVTTGVTGNSSGEVVGCTGF